MRIIIWILVLGVFGVVMGHMSDRETGGWIGLIIGLILGTVLGIYVRRQKRAHIQKKK